MMCRYQGGCVFQDDPTAIWDRNHRTIADTQSFDNMADVKSAKKRKAEKVEGAADGDFVIAPASETPKLDTSK